MIWTHVIEHVAILICSFAVGIAVYFLMSRAPMKEKKARVNWLVSIVIQLVIYVWIAKALMQFSTLIKDPLAVLAYPSNATIFYIALLFLAMHLWIHIKKNVLSVEHMIEVFVPVFIHAQFVYQCVQLMQTERIAYLVSAFITLVLIVIYIAVEKIHTPSGYGLLFFVWALGSIILSLLFTHNVLFGYTVSPLIYVLFMIGTAWMCWTMRGKKEF